MSIYPPRDPWASACAAGYGYQPATRSTGPTLVSFDGTGRTITFPDVDALVDYCLTVVTPADAAPDLWPIVTRLAREHPDVAPLVSLELGGLIRVEWADGTRSSYRPGTPVASLLAAITDHTTGPGRVHLTRDDGATVCGKPPGRALRTTPASWATVERLRGEPVSDRSLCLQCWDAMRTTADEGSDR